MDGHKQHWRDLIAANEAGYEELSQGDVFEGWDKLISPEGRVERPLEYAIELACGDGSRTLVGRFLGHCLELADRAVREKVYGKKVCKKSYPLNLARILRAKAYALWLRDGHLDTDCVAESVALYSRWCATATASDQGAEGQEFYSSGLCLAVLLGRGPAKDVLDLRPPCPDAGPGYRGIRLAVSAYAENSALSPAVLDEYHRLFQAGRDPRSGDPLPNIFEMGLVRHVVLTGSAAGLNPWDIIEVISE